MDPAPRLLFQNPGPRARAAATERGGRPRTAGTMMAIVGTAGHTTDGSLQICTPSHSGRDWRHVYARGAVQPPRRSGRRAWHRRNRNSVQRRGGASSGGSTEMPPGWAGSVLGVIRLSGSSRRPALTVVELSPCSRRHGDEGKSWRRKEARLPGQRLQRAASFGLVADHL
jgi:hypothetical protein